MNFCVLLHAVMLIIADDWNEMLAKLINIKSLVDWTTFLSRRVFPKGGALRQFLNYDGWMHRRLLISVYRILKPLVRPPADESYIGQWRWSILNLVHINLNTMRNQYTETPTMLLFINFTTHQTDLSKIKHLISFTYHLCTTQS